MKEIQRKKQKVVNRNGWQARLYKWTWGVSPNFIGWCPMFWVTWGNILISPLTLIAKIVAFIFTLTSSFFKPLPRKEKVAERKVTLSDKDVITLNGLIETYGNTQKTIKLLSYRYRSFIEDNPNWRETHLAPALKRKAQSEERAKILEQRRKAREKYFNKVTQYLQYLVKPVLVVSCLAVAFVLYKFFFWIAGTVTLAGILTGAKFIGSGILFVLGCLVASYLFEFIFTKMKFSEPQICREGNEYESASEPGFFGNILATIINGIVEAISFIKETIVTAYKSECPLIVWSDEETKPIEKINKD